MLSLLLSLSLPVSDTRPDGPLWSIFTPFDITSYRKLIKDTPFTLLQITDLHICRPDGPDLSNAFSMAESLIIQIQPDLILLTGDTVCGNPNGIFANLTISFLDQFKIPYTFVFGNHDDEGPTSIEDLAVTFSNGQYSWFDRGPGSIHGYSNSAINLLNSSNELIYSLILVDSNRYRNCTKNSMGYDYVYPDQVSWYRWFLDGMKEYTKKQVKSMLFFHITLPEIHDVRADLKKKDSDAEAFAFKENPSPSGQNSSFWKMIKDTASTTHLFFGHDHGNLLNYSWEGVMWVYGLKTGPSFYHLDDRMGGTVITVEQNGNVNVRFVYKTVDEKGAPKWREFIEQKIGKKRPKVKME
jgi:hypothetical protein